MISTSKPFLNSSILTSMDSQSWPCYGVDGFLRQIRRFEDQFEQESFGRECDRGENMCNQMGRGGGLRGHVSRRE